MFTYHLTIFLYTHISQFTNSISYIPDCISSLHSNPLRNGAILFHLFRQFHLYPESLMGSLKILTEFTRLVFNRIGYCTSKMANLHVAIQLSHNRKTSICQ